MPAVSPENATLSRCRYSWAMVGNATRDFRHERDLVFLGVISFAKDVASGSEHNANERSHHIEAAHNSFTFSVWTRGAWRLKRRRFHCFG